MKLRHIIPVLLGLIVFLVMALVRPGEAVYHPVSVTVDDTAGLVDEQVLQSQIEDASFRQPLHILIYTGDGEHAGECGIEGWCLEPLYPDFFEDSELADDVMAIWVKPTQNIAQILLPRGGAYRENVIQTESEITQDLSYAWAGGRLDEEILPALVAGDDAYHRPLNEGSLLTSRFVHAGIGGLLAGGLTWVILAAWSQFRNRHYPNRTARRQAIAHIREVFTDASHDLDGVALASLDNDRGLRAWNSDYVELTRGLANADFLDGDRFSAGRYDSVVFVLDELAQRVSAGRAALRGGHPVEQESRADVAPVTKRRMRLPLHPLAIAASCLAALIIGLTTGVITARTGEPAEVVYADASGLDLDEAERTQAKVQYAPEGSKLHHFASITIHDEGGYIDDPDALKNALMSLGFEGSVPLVIMTYGGDELDKPTDYWESWLVPTYPDDVDASSDYPFYFRDTGTVYLWYAPGALGARGVDYNRLTTPLRGSSDDIGYRARFDPKSYAFPDTSAELMIWNAMTDLAMWSTAPDPDHVPVAGRAFSRGLVSTLLSLPLILAAAYLATRVLRNVRDPRRQFDQMRDELTRLGLARDALRLDLLDRARTYSSAEARWEAFDHAYEQAVRYGGGNEHRDQARESFLAGGEKRDLALGWTFLAQAQAESLWRLRAVEDGEVRAQVDDIADLARVDRDRRATYEAVKADPARIDQLARRSDRASVLRGLSIAEDRDVEMLARLGAIGAPELGHRSFELVLPEKRPVTRTRMIAMACAAVVLLGIWGYSATAPRTALYRDGTGQKRVEVRVEGGGHMVTVSESIPLEVENDMRRGEGREPLLTPAHLDAGADTGAPVQVVLDARETPGYCAAQNYWYGTPSSSPVVLFDSPWDFHELAPNVVWVCLDPTTARIATSSHLAARTDLSITPGPIPDQIDELVDIFGRGPVFDQVLTVPE